MRFSAAWGFFRIHDARWTDDPSTPTCGQFVSIHRLGLMGQMSTKPRENIYCSIVRHSTEPRVGCSWWERSDRRRLELSVLWRGVWSLL
jgi:hypothetical protein